MHPVMLQVPGACFELLGPLLVLYGLVSLARALLVRAPVTDATTDVSVERDPPGNALLAIAAGVGLVLFTAPTGLANGTASLGTALRTLGHIATWKGGWRALPIYSYGVMLGTSFVCGWAITLGLAARQGLPRERIGDVYVILALAALLGARLLYVATNPAEFVDPDTHAFALRAVFSARTGGLVAYGGFLGGVLAGVVAMRALKLPFWPLADAAAPSLALGLACTRLGCYLYGCDFGRPLPPLAPHWLARLGTFPRWPDRTGPPAWFQHVHLGFASDATRCRTAFHGLVSPGACFLPDDALASVPVHPTQLYESLVGLALAALMVRVWKRRVFEGEVFLACGIAYGLARALLETLRDDRERGFVMGVSTSQWIGVATAVVCAVLYVRLRRTGTRATGLDLFARETWRMAGRGAGPVVTE